MNIRGYFLYTLLGLAIVAYWSLVSPANLWGAESEYELVAVNFLKFVHSRQGIISFKVLQSLNQSPSQPKIPIAYLAELEGGGYILISASKGLTPIKAYSLRDNFETLPEKYRAYLLSELEYRVRNNDSAETEGTKSRLKQADEYSNQERWAFLLDYRETRSLYKYTPNTILLQTKWAQKNPYNKFLPQINDQPVKVGCTNVAIAQVMKYHHYPSSGQGIVSYTWNSQNLKAVLSKNYHWENMPDSLNLLTPQNQIDEVARLLRDIAIANQTEFGVDASSTSLKREVLVKYFGYSNSLKTMSNSSESLFFTTLRSEIEALRPVLLQFPGHMTVADGYSSSPAGREIHVNFGWGDHSDGYYFLDQSVVTATHTAPFTTDPGDLKIYYYLKPCSEDDCDINLETEDRVVGTTISGRFDTEYDSDEFRVYLKGVTTINGYRNFCTYQNRAFIISIFDLGKNLIACNTGHESKSLSAISTNLPAGKYIIKISLCNELEDCYTYQPFVYYITSVSTKALTASEKEIANSYDPPPVIYNDFKDIVINASLEPPKILIEAIDESGGAVSLSAASTNAAIHASINNQDLLTITPIPGLTKAAAKISVTASSNGKSAGKSFLVLIANETIYFGQEFEIIGLFSNQSTFNKHKAILDGPCIITGDNGYANQGFYSSVMDLNGNFLVSTTDKKIEYQSDRDYHLIGASLKQNPVSIGGYQYVYQEGKGDIYSLKVCCPQANVDIARLATWLDISLRGTGLKNPPALTIEANRDCGLPPLEVGFFSNGRDYDGNVVSYQWHFGDGLTSTQRDPIHTFTAAGDYTVQCTIKDNDGLTSDNTFLVKVNQDRMKITDLQGLPLEGFLTDGFAAGRNFLYLYNISCSLYTSYGFLFDCHKDGQPVNLHHLDSASGSVNSSYWFFGRISGQEYELPEEAGFTGQVPGESEGLHFIDSLSQ